MRQGSNVISDYVLHCCSWQNKQNQEKIREDGNLGSSFSFICLVCFRDKIRTGIMYPTEGTQAQRAEQKAWLRQSSGDRAAMHCCVRSYTCCSGRPAPNEETTYRQNCTRWLDGCAQSHGSAAIPGFSTAEACSCPCVGLFLVSLGQGNVGKEVL